MEKGGGNAVNPKMCRFNWMRPYWYRSDSTTTTGGEFHIEPVRNINSSYYNLNNLDNTNIGTLVGGQSSLFYRSYLSFIKEVLNFRNK